MTRLAIAGSSFLGHAAIFVSTIRPRAVNCNNISLETLRCPALVPAAVLSCPVLYNSARRLRPRPQASLVLFACPPPVCSVCCASPCRPSDPPPHYVPRRGPVRHPAATTAPATSVPSAAPTPARLPACATCYFFVVRAPASAAVTFTLVRQPWVNRKSNSSLMFRIPVRRRARLSSGEHVPFTTP